jgi:hypothetical protein
MTGWYPNPCNSSTFCRELEGALAGEVSASGRFHALFRAHLGLPARLRRPFGLKDRFSPSPATGTAIRSAQGAFHAGEHPEEDRTWPGEPDKAPCSFGGGPLSTGCSQPVDKGPAHRFILHRALL